MNAGARRSWRKLSPNPIPLDVGVCSSTVPALYGNLPSFIVAIAGRTAVSTDVIIKALVQIMTNVLLIGLDPKYVDFTNFPTLNEQKLSASLKAEEARLTGLGYQTEWCLLDRGETAEASVLERLGTKKFDCILIGAGVRTMQAHFLLFEKLINLVHAHAPQAKLCFNTNPDDSVEAVQRWVMP
jgi:hypothetical protein